MNKVILPDFWDEEDKANYDMLVAHGQALIGTKIKKCDSFLLDMSAKMTINKLKGYNTVPEDIMEQMQMHKNAMQDTHIITPEGLYEEGNHPLQLNKALTDQPIYEEKHPSDLNILE
jgi:hypothetical protein